MRRYVFGLGEEKTPFSFRNACDDFILTESLGGTASPSGPQPAAEGRLSDEAHDVVTLLKAAASANGEADCWTKLRMPAM